MHRIWVCSVSVCMSMCVLACFYLSAAGHALMVCVASVVSIPVRSWLKESKSDRASHSDLRPASEGNTEPSNFANVYETDGFGMRPHNSSTRGWGRPSVFSVSVCLMIGCCIYSSLLTKLLPISPAAIWGKKGDLWALAQLFADYSCTLTLTRKHLFFCNDWGSQICDPGPNQA